MITRRAFAVGLQGVVAGLASRTIRERDMDDELLALRPQWQEARAAFDVILAAKAPVELASL